MTVLSGRREEREEPASPHSPPNRTKVSDDTLLVTVRNRVWVASDVVRGTVASGNPVAMTQRPPHLVKLVSIEDDAHDESALRVVWELERGAVAHDQHALPSPADGFDQPGQLAAFLDAVRWGAIASADKTVLQAPFRSGIKIEEYQLDPVVRALSMPRTNLLIADDVGLGKTIEAGLVMQELMLRHRAPPAGRRSSRPTAGALGGRGRCQYSEPAHQHLCVCEKSPQNPPTMKIICHQLVTFLVRHSPALGDTVRSIMTA
jgi:hypothetical protein